MMLTVWADEYCPAAGVKTGVCAAAEPRPSIPRIKEIDLTDFKLLKPHYIEKISFNSAKPDPCGIEPHIPTESSRRHGSNPCSCHNYAKLLHTQRGGGMITIVLREELRSNAYKRHISCLGAIQLYGNIHRKINRLLVTGNRFNLPTSEGTANSAPGRMKQNNMLTRNQDCAKRHWRFRPAWFDSSPLQERDCCSRKSSDCHQQ